MEKDTLSKPKERLDDNDEATVELDESSYEHVWENTFDVSKAIRRNQLK